MMTEEDINRIALRVVYMLELLREEREGKAQTEDEPKSTRFKRPSDDEVRDYFDSQGFYEMAQGYLDYQDAVGWKTSKGQIRDWKASVRNWIRKEGEFQSRRGGGRKQVITADTGDDASFDLEEFVKLSQAHAFDPF